MDSTLDRRDDSLSPTKRRAPLRWALVVLWSRRDGDRIGELAWVDPGRTRVLGRPARDATDRLRLVRQRPGGDEPGGPIASKYVSRDQLRVRVLGTDALHVHNVGRVGLRVNGHDVGQGQVRVGDVLELDRELLLLATRRPAWLPPLDTPDHPFGAANSDGIVGEGPSVWTLRRRLEFLADQPGHVLITGASGTGKELVARALHARSGRRRGPWVPSNAAAVPEGIAEAEWFGNRPDYPNAGMPARKGLAGEADGGTWFLDELGELPHALQAHLLRLLDGGEVQRLGEARPRRVDVRVVAATNRDPSALKHDVLARFPHRIHLPGLDARREDVPLLVRSLLRGMAERRPALGRFLRQGVPRLTPRLWLALHRHRFTGHVRELQQLLWASAAEAEGDWLDTGPEVAVSPEPAAQPLPATSPDELGPEQIEAALVAADGVKERAWRALGLRNRHQLRRLMQKHGLT